MSSLSQPVASPSGTPHVVQFYRDDVQLSRVVADFLATGLAQDEVAIAIATAPHREAVVRALIERQVDVASMMHAGQLVIVDAEATLAKISKASMPDPEAFGTVIGGLVESADPTRAGRVRIYGEMVDLLLKRGNSDAAVRLEALWNALRVQRPLSLLCAYALDGVSTEPELREICATHDHVLAPSNGNASDDEARARSASPVRALVEEIARRADMERGFETQRLRVAERSERLVKVTAAIADAVSADDVFAAVVDQVADALGASTGALWMFDEDRTTVSMRRSIGYPEIDPSSVQAVPLDHEPSSPALDTLRTGSPSWLDSPEELAERYPEFARILTLGKPSRVASLPLTAEGRTLGALTFGWDGSPATDDNRRSFLMLVARYTGQALERLRLLESERQSRARAEAARERAELLYGLARSLIEDGRIEQAFEAALHAIGRALGTSRSAVLTLDREGVMRFVAWNGLSDEYRAAVEGHSPWPADGVDPRPIIIEDTSRDSRVEVFRDLLQREGIGALGFIPLVASGRLTGKLMVYFDRPTQLSSHELDMATAIANHVATAVARFASAEELQRAVRFNEMFTGVLGHDLRNPLNAIMTGAQLALKRGESEKLVKPLARILNSGERMARMIDQLLDFTHVRVGEGIPLRRQQLDLVPLLKQIIDELDDANPEWTMRLTHHGDPCGEWDPDRLGQVFSNLVGNALQHGRAEDGVHVRLDGSDPAIVRVEVHNAGFVPEELIPKVFDPLTGGDRRRQKSQGMGLGLFISQQIARAHRGDIAVRSDETLGTTFTVSLPRRNGPLPKPKAVAQ